MKKAKAAVMTGVNEPFEVKEYPIEPLSEGMALTKLIASGICGTDIHIHTGKLLFPCPVIIGHECIGEVVDISEAEGQKYGIGIHDHVFVFVASPCGECALCKAGDDANCVNAAVTYLRDPSETPHFHGGFGEYTVSPVQNLIRLPGELDPLMTCVFACAGPTAIHAFRLAEKANCGIKDVNVAVVQGLGPVGLFAVIYLASLGVRHIIAVTTGNNPHRDEMALRFGATEVMSLNKAGTGDVVARIRELNHGLGADLAFEASGNPDAFAEGLGMLRNRGVYLVPGQYSNSGGIAIMPQLITFNALHIIGSSQYSAEDVRLYLAFLLGNKALHDGIRELASCYTVADINKAVEDAKAGRNIKTLLIPE